jgi:mannose-6-phosphate isomerase
MAIRQLERQVVEKVWGRRDIPALFGDASQFSEPVGEVWFQDEAATELLVKRLFTSEKLSIQVHPSDELARASGYPRGKDEAWFVLSADPGATIGAGFKTELTSDELRAAALDGSIEDLLVWHPVKPGDFFYVPAGTVHAIGAGLSVLEIQQNVDLTYRLYDYGRPRPLQLEEGVAASLPRPFTHRPVSCVSDRHEILVVGPKFVIERLRGPIVEQIGASPTDPVWLMPIAGDCAIGAAGMDPGSVWLADTPTQVQLGSDGYLLIAYAGADTI